MRVRRLLPAALLLVAALSTLSALGDECADAGRVIDEKNGYRDTKLGTPFDAFTGLVPARQDVFKTNKVTAFVRPRDDKALFGQRLESISYLFHDGRLALIQLHFAGSADGLEIIRGFETALGCESTNTGAPPLLRIELRAAGEHAGLLAWYILSEVGRSGTVQIYDRAAVGRIQAEVEREASSQF